MMMHIPRATYRIQLNSRCKLSSLFELTDYFDQLGISDLYLSPILAARQHTVHGYDVIDHGRLNPEIGSEGELCTLADQLQAQGMAILLDIVPNHMYIASPENRWWWDLLKYGERSYYAHYFDIDWHSNSLDLEGKILLPFLGSSLSEEIQEGTLVIVDEEGEARIDYCGMQFPIDPATLSEEDIAKLLTKQHYRPDHWMRGFRDLNYRRFFDITELACLRLEQPEVFEDVHRLIFQWIEKGWVSGLRIDHVDGLYDPERYFRDVQEHSGGVYLVVEKILAREEELPQRWEVQGTTGYDFLNDLNGLFVDSDRKKMFSQVYTQFTGQFQLTEELVEASKKQILGSSMVPEVKRLLALLQGLTDQRQELLETALEALLSVFPVYRTYIRPPFISEADNKILQTALAKAKQQEPTLPAAIWDCLEKAIRTNRPFAMRFQQTSAPVMAKGYEDTALYRYFPLASLNEVGSDIAYYANTITAFHRHNQQRQKLWPYSLLATTTHDSKHSEDVRARLNTLSEIPREWEMRLKRWHELNHNGSSLGANEEYLLYQTLIGTFPLMPMRRFEHRDYVERICCCMQKSVKEAKRWTNWIEPNLEYEEKVDRFVRCILEPNGWFIRDLHDFVTTLSYPGMYNSLAQTLLKICSPGVPDFFQGNEVWSFRLVDPDNRESVDFHPLQEFLHQLSSLEEMLDHLEDGRIKLHLIQTGLQLRKRYPELLTTGDYLPLVAEGERKNQLVSFGRYQTKKTVIVAVGRFFMQLPNPGRPCGSINWGNSHLPLPPPLAGQTYRELFTQRIYCGESLPLAELFSAMPIALLESQ